MRRTRYYGVAYLVHRLLAATALFGACVTLCLLIWSSRQIPTTLCLTGAAKGIHITAWKGVVALEGFFVQAHPSEPRGVFLKKQANPYWFHSEYLGPLLIGNADVIGNPGWFVQTRIWFFALCLAIIPGSGLPLLRFLVRRKRRY